MSNKLNLWAVLAGPEQSVRAVVCYKHSKYINKLPSKLMATQVRVENLLKKIDTNSCQICDCESSES